MTKNQMLEKFFYCDERDEDCDEYYVVKPYHIEYLGDTVNSVDVENNELFVNSDRERSYNWKEAKVKDFTVYELKVVDLS